MSDFDDAMDKARESDREKKLEYATPVRVDFTWYYNVYGTYPDTHGVCGKVFDYWQDVDGFYLYMVKSEDGESGAFSREDLVVV